MVLVRKKDGGLRWCVDYRRLNEVTEKDAYPLPKIEECIDTLSGAKWFSTLDLQSGYWQVAMDLKDKAKTAFTTKYGLYEYNRMPFGLCNAPGTFQRAMELIMRGLQWKTVLIYLDDIIIVSATYAEHISRLREVLTRLRQHGLKLKPRKCHLLQRQVEFLGHAVNGEGVHTNPRLVMDIRERKPPRSLRELQAFLGLCNYYRRFVPSYAEITRPLISLTAKEAEFHWGPEQEAAFKDMKSKLTEAPILAYPRPEATFLLDTDASEHSIGCVLSQEQDGEERVISYASAALQPAQQRYCVTRKELLAVIRFTRQFRHYLLGQRFRLRTDHASLVWLFRFKTPEGQLARWLEELSQFDFVIEHREGKRHGNADGMSRLDMDEPGLCDCYTTGSKPQMLPCGGCDYCSKRHDKWERFNTEVDYVVPLAVRQISVGRPTGFRVDQKHPPQDCPWLDLETPESLRKKQLDDMDLRVVHGWLEGGPPPKERVSLESPTVRNYWLLWSQIEDRDGILFYKWEEGETSQLRLLVPASMQSHIIQTHHDPPTAGHPGVERTLGLIRQHYHWYGMRKDVEGFVRKCQACAVNKRENQRRWAELQGYHAGLPMERLHLDVMGPFPTSDKGNRYVLAVIDQFTKWAEAYPLPDQTADSTARTVVNEIIARFGAPLSIHTDQGRNFESELVS